ncbi:MAG: peptidylprolyl isomerase [Candidatus Nitrosopumilus limneticus]|nr:peptidylprolyl isomerase [Candidatus Nitrosopumilus limneticus]
MKTKAISSIFLLFTISISMISIAPNAFADHHEITITPISGSGSDSGCELTEEGCYSPNPVTVYVGSVIIFSNTESVSHTFSSGVPSDDVIGVEFNSGMLEPGSSFQWIPENVGEFPYFDMIHPWMQGTIIVQEATEKTHEKMETHSEVAEETVVEEQVVEETVVEEQVVEETVVATQESEENGGGCLIATATYGSELAPQVQLLREIRDNSLLQTESGSAFMGTFNDIYYTFSPTIADYERESPIFKEAVKLTITPMITTLSIMENANSESEVLGLGLSIIALNLGMYIGIPAVVIIGIRKRF